MLVVWSWFLSYKRRRGCSQQTLRRRGRVKQTPNQFDIGLGYDLLEKVLFFHVSMRVDFCSYKLASRI